MGMEASRSGMTIVGVGIDIVDVATVEGARFKMRLAEYFLTSKEQALVPQGRTRTQHLASRFAAKEAVIKAFPKPLKPHEFEVLKKGAQPYIVFEKKQYNAQYVVSISLTHTPTTAAAVAIVSH